MYTLDVETHYTPIQTSQKPDEHFHMYVIFSFKVHKFINKLIFTLEWNE